MRVVRRWSSSPRIRWDLKNDKKDNVHVTHAVLKTIAAFLNTDGGDLLIGVDDDGTPIGIGHDGFESDDKYTRHLEQVVLNGLGDRTGTRVDPVVQDVDGVPVCLVAVKRGLEPVRLSWKGVEKDPEGDFYVRNGPRTDRLALESAEKYIATRWGSG